MDYAQILAKNPRDLMEWLLEEFTVEIPHEIITTDDMDEAASLMMQLSSYFSYLCTLSSYAKIATREVKREGDKIAYEDMVDRKEIIQNMLDAVKQQYSAVSRAVTVRIENNNELRMNSGGYIRDTSV